jgi:hypothetical protein
MVAVEENAAIYAWANNESAPITPGTPTIYDPLNDALIRGIIDAVSTIVGPGSAEVLYDNAGTTFQGADDLAFKVQNFSGTITTGVTMSWTVISGKVNGKTSADGPQSFTLSGGVATLSPMSMDTDSALIQIAATVGGVSIPVLPVTFTKVRAAPTPGGTGGGGTGSDDVASQSSGFIQINTATFTTITSGLKFTLPSGKTTLRVVISLSCKYPKTANQDGPWDVEFKVRRGGVDQGSVQHSNPDPYLYDDPDYGTLSNAGTMQYTLDMTSLTPGTQYSVDIQARVASGALPSSSNMNFTGTVTLSAP